MKKRCPICGVLPVRGLTVHHLCPKVRGVRGKNHFHETQTKKICEDCHQKIHSLFSNSDLAELDFSEVVLALKK